MTQCAQRAKFPTTKRMKLNADMAKSPFAEVRFLNPRLLCVLRRWKRTSQYLPVELHAIKAITRRTAVVTAAPTVGLRTVSGRKDQPVALRHPRTPSLSTVEDELSPVRCHVAL
jgi:hypothetical protein